MVEGREAQMEAMSEERRRGEGNENKRLMEEEMAAHETKMKREKGEKRQWKIWKVDEASGNEEKGRQERIREKRREEQWESFSGKGTHSRGPETGGGQVEGRDGSWGEQGKRFRIEGQLGSENGGEM